MADLKFTKMKKSERAR